MFFSALRYMKSKIFLAELSQFIKWKRVSRFFIFFLSYFRQLYNYSYRVMSTAEKAEQINSR